MNKGRWIKPAGKTTAPRAIASVVVISKPDTSAGNTSRTPLVWDHAYLAFACRGKSGWESTEPVAIASGRELHRAIEAAAPHRGRLWVVSPFSGNALTLSSWYDLLEQRGALWQGRGAGTPHGDPRPTPTPKPSPVASGRRPQPAVSDRGTPSPYIIRTLVLRGKPDIIKYSIRGKSLTWVSLSQYFPFAPDALAELIGFNWGEFSPGCWDHRDGNYHGADLCGMNLRIFQKLSDWWVQVDGGPFGPTPGTLGMSFVRKRIAPKVLLSHDIPGAADLEERAIWGGRASSWYLGAVQSEDDGPGLFASPPPARGPGELFGPLDHWDVSSMYPTILRNETFPCKLIKTWDQPSVHILKSLLDDYAVLADVRIKTAVSEYPYRSGDRVIYPVGEFDTTLAGPELSRALAAGEVLSCHRATAYTRGRPFMAPADELLTLRRAYAKPETKAWEAFVKLVSNNIGGKMAQRRYDWVPRPDVPPPKPWAVWTHVRAGTGDSVTYRSRAGLVEERCPAKAGGRPLAACFAYLTAYGRSMMRDVRELMPPRTVVSQDTDGVWILTSARPHIESVVRILLGKGYSLRHTRTVARARFHGPRHYWADGEWTLSGMHDPVPQMSSLTFSYSYSINPAAGSCDRTPRHVFECTEEAPLRGVYWDGKVDVTGWVIPSRIRPPVHHPDQTPSPSP